MIKTFWLLLSVGCVIWYMVVLVVVIIKGAKDIKDLLRSLTDVPEK